MHDVAIIGLGQVPVGEHWDMGLRQLALGAIHAALQDAGIERVDALIVGNALGGNLSAQNHLGTLIADFAGLSGVERGAWKRRMLLVGWRCAGLSGGGQRTGGDGAGGGVERRPIAPAASARPR